MTIASGHMSVFRAPIRPGAHLNGDRLSSAQTPVHLSTMLQSQTPSSPTQPDSQDPSSQLRKVIPFRWTPNQAPVSPSDTSSQVEDSQAEEDILAPPLPTPPRRVYGPTTTFSCSSTQLLESRINTPKMAAISLDADRISEYERRIPHLEREVYALR